MMLPNSMQGLASIYATMYIMHALLLGNSLAYLCNEALVGFCKVDRCCQVYIELLAPVVQYVCTELL